MKERSFSVENKTIVGVTFKSDKSGEFEGRTYSYYCDIPVVVGDIVVAPTSRGETVARVCEVDVPLSKVDMRIKPLMKTISTLADKEEPHVN